MSTRSTARQGGFNGDPSRRCRSAAPDRTRAFATITSAWIDLSKVVHTTQQLGTIRVRCAIAGAHPAPAIRGEKLRSRALSREATVEANGLKSGTASREREDRRRSLGTISASTRARPACAISSARSAGAALGGDEIRRRLFRQARNRAARHARDPGAGFRERGAERTRSRAWRRPCLDLGRGDIPHRGPITRKRKPSDVIRRSAEGVGDGAMTSRAILR